MKHFLEYGAAKSFSMHLIKNAYRVLVAKFD